MSTPINMIKTGIFPGFLSLFTALIISSLAFGQVVNFSQFGVENGLPQSQVNTIVQDDDGNLWVGTVSGLAKYNGIEFTSYYKSDSLAEDWVTASFKDDKGNLWFGHWGGSITRYDKVTNEFQSISVEKFSSYQEVSDFVEDTLRRKIIFGTKGSGIFIYDVERQTVNRYEVDGAVEGSRHIHAVYLDAGGNLWIGTEDNGIYIVKLVDLLNNEKTTFKHLNTENGLSGNHIRDIEEFDGEMWVATEQGISYWQYTQNEAVIAGKGKGIIEIFDDESELNTNDITSFEKDRHGQLWIGTKDKGIVMCVILDDEYTFRHYSIDQGLSFYSAKCLYLDRENTLWIGTDVGLNQYISDYFTLYDESVGISNNIILSVVSDSKGSIWLGSTKGISQLLNADKLNNDSLKVGEYDIDGLSNDAVMSMFEDAEGYLWFGTIRGAVFKRSPKGSFEKLSLLDNFQEVIHSIAEDNDGNIWLGTRGGAARINKKTNVLSVFNEEDGLGGNSVYKILKADDGTLWFGVVGGKLSSYDGKEFKVYDEADGMNHNLVLSLAKDGIGNIWIGCYTGGLYKYDGEKFTNFNKDSGMKSETPYSIVADLDNNIWYGTTYGIEKYDQKTGKFEHFGKSEGFLGIQVNPNATCMDSKGNVWFGTILGAVKYNSRVHYPNNVKPILSLSSRIEINHEEDDMHFNHEYDQTENSLSFHYTGVSLNNSSKLHYKYKLEGHPKFSEYRTTKDRVIAFNNLKAKKYNLEIRAVNADLVESDPVNYKFEITVPLYDSMEFYIFQFLLIALMLTLAVYFGRKTGGSRVATVLASIAIIITFEYGVNYVEDSLEQEVGGVVFIKVGLNVILGLILFPVEKIIKERLIKVKVEE